MHVILAEFTLKSPHIEAFIERVQQQSRDSLENEPGCHVFDVCVDRNTQPQVVLYEVYENAEAFELHLNTPHFKSFDSDVADWIEDKQVRHYEKL